MHSKLLSYTLCLLPLAQAGKTLIDASCFDSNEALEEYFDYLYPWGEDHNGSARMVGNSTEHEYVSVESGTLTLVAKPASGQPPTKGGDEIHYLSGAVHSKDTFTVEAGSGFDISVELQATVDKGTWPAFWLNGAESWPPEIDLAEWKGTGDISFNTFNSSSEVEEHNTEYASPDDFHTVKTEIRDVDGTNISVQFYLDDTLMATQHGGEYVGKPLHLIINLQMEGSSGTPGPDTDTFYRIRNLSFEQI
ncbi:putative glycoside hydrolase [Aspergillus campestris IBT 28561]|uniref:Glycoside hydrolase n=1 Tax=Aspergillus campestris (strain IBT 28561) TaxID=1392248 RepID=A0A2I1CR19_ASPC2|nr:putative glycoside hydrolase [Aspergillus campestris IBT 28561]PKY00067.1 putative glycoside hydrolase [Aspergillus campestris IBT 28561]